MKKLSLLSLLVLTLFACRKDVNEKLSTESTPNPVISTIDYDPIIIDVTATLYGTVENEAGEFIENATIQIGNNTVSSDEKGRFLLKDITMNKAGTLVKITKSGYFENSYRFFPQENSINYLKKILLDRTIIGSFVAGDGAVLTSPEGITLDFPANSIIDEDGNTYSGTVEVAARWLDPTSPVLGQIMPGSLDGLTNLLDEVSLFTAGMIQVELQSSTGAALNLGNGQKATMSATLPNAILQNAPETIPLWYFNNELGLWIEEGEATLVGNEYVGEVAHFTYWNYDGSLPAINLSGTIVDVEGNPVPAVHVWVEATSGWSIGHGDTDQNGFFSGLVTADQELVLKINNYSGCSPTIGIIGPFSVDTDLGNVVIPLTAIETQIPVTANLIDCDGNPVTSGFLEVTANNGNTTLYYTDNGEVSFTLSSCNNDITEIDVLAYDLNNAETGNLTNYPITDPMVLTNLSACGNQIDNFVKVYIDGALTQTFLPPGISIWGIGTDSLEIQGGFQNLGVYMSLSGVTGEGVYNNSNIAYLSQNVEAQNGDILSNSCQSTCTYDIVEFTFIGGVGEDVEGYWEGTGIEFENITTGGIVNHDIRVEFDIQRD